METNCISCSEKLFPQSLFCHNCGSQQKCKSCDTPIIKNAKYCIGCGNTLAILSNEPDKAVNTIKFNQTLDSRSYEVAFTDNVASGVVDVIKNMSEYQQPLRLYELNNEPLSSNNNEPNNRIEEDIIEHFEIEKIEEEQIINISIPHVNDIENTLDCSEQHWILIYAFYISNHGKETFSKDDLLKAYKEKRATKSRIANFSTKWKSLFKGMVKTIKENEFKLTKQGVDIANDLITGKLKSEVAKSLPGKSKFQKGKTEKKEITTVKKTGKSSPKSIQTQQFDLHKSSSKLSLIDFLQERKIDNNTTNRILAIAYYITSLCKINTFSDGNIEFAYKALGLNKRPLHLHQTIVNIKNNKLWFEQDESNGNWKLTRVGEVYFEENFTKN